MEIIVENDYSALSKRAAKIVGSYIKKNPQCVLGLATGSTPIKMYNLLGKKYKKGEISFKRVKTFNLDEYFGLENDDPQSYHSFMKKNFFRKINIDYKNTFFPTDFTKKYKEYDKMIKKVGGIDIQILGIGSNGHIGFNEPNSDFFSETRKISLKDSTIKDNSRFFSNIKNVPTKAVTMGIATILRAKMIILLASGKNKKEAIYKAFFCKISKKVPASILQKHKNLTVILDKDVAWEKNYSKKTSRK